MIKVLHVLCDLNGGGAERVVLELCRRASAEVRAEVAVLHEGGELADSFERAGVVVHGAGRTRGRVGARAALRLAALARRYHVIHTHLWAGDTWGRLAAGLVGHACVVTTEHNTVREPGWRGRVDHVLTHLNRAVICVSRDAARAAIERGVPADRVHVVHNGIDLALFPPRGPAEGPARRLLAVGRLTEQKGFDVLVEALRRCSGLRLEIAGEGEQRSRLQGQATLLGWVEDTAPLYRRADLVVVPSRWEGFGLVALEAMASGVPVVASDIGALREVLGDAGALVRPGDPVALASALTRVACDVEALRAMRQRGIERSRTFDIQGSVCATEELYRSLLGRSIGTPVHCP